MLYPPLLLRDDIEQYPPFLPRDDIEQYVPTREQKQFIFLHHYNVNGLTMSRGYCKISSSSFEGGNIPLGFASGDIAHPLRIRRIFYNNPSTWLGYCIIVTYQKWFPMLNGGMVFSNIIPLFIQYHTTIWIVVWYWKIPYHHSPSENGNPLNFA